MAIRHGHRHLRLLLPQATWPVQQRGILGSAAAVAGDLTTDATFRYRSLDWRTSSGERHDYEYVVAQQPAGGATARDALTALEEYLPRPPSGWTVVLIPSVSTVCSGKEEMRPLATLLSQRGHRCYVLEWPGWTQNVQTNWALERCKLESFGEEYEDFWCQALEHVALREAADVEEAQQREDAAGRGKAVPQPRICVLGAGSSGIYAMRALKALCAWEPLPDAPPSVATAEALNRYESLVMLAPSWRTLQRGGMLSWLKPERAAYWMGAFLHSDSRIGRIYRYSHFSRQNLQRHFMHAGAPDGNEERLFALAEWLFNRPRPYAQTDAVAACGFLDPPKTHSVSSLAAEMSEAASVLRHGVLLLSPETSPPVSSPDGQSLVEALKASIAAQSSGVVEHRYVSSSSPLPHEIALTSVQFAIEQWLLRESTAEE